jgi:hypothetical protein
MACVGHDRAQGFPTQCVEAFNFPNHPNFLAPATDVRQPATFGKITAARTMRELQFGVKYVF